jgi:hypothetical protein
MHRYLADSLTPRKRGLTRFIDPGIFFIGRTHEYPRELSRDPK